MDTTLTLLSVGMVLGTILTLYFISRRPVNVNLKVDARAEAHGGSAHTSAGPVPVSSGSGGALNGIGNIFKALAAIALIGLVVYSISVMNQPAIVVHVPTQPAPVINVQPPVVNVPKQEPPVVNVPAQRPPVINVPAQPAPVVNVNTEAETLSLILTALGLLVIIVVSVLVLRAMRPRQAAPATHHVDYVKTNYGYTPKKGIPVDAYPDLFSQKVKTK